MKVGRYNCKFNFLFREEKMANVVIENVVVSTIPYTDEKLHLPFGWVPDRKVTRKTIDYFFEEHCIPRHKDGIEDFLAYNGLEEFDAYKICRLSEGRMLDSLYSIEWLD